MSGLFRGEQVADKSVPFDKLEDEIFQNIPIASSDEVLTNTASGFKANLSLVVDGTYAVLYGKEDDQGNPIELGRVNISTGTIQDAYYDSETNEIVLVIQTSGGTDEIRMPADDLVDVYTASGYIDLDIDNNFTLNYNLLKDDLINDGFVTESSLDLDEYAKINETRNFYTSANVRAGGNFTTENALFTGNKTTTNDGIPGVVATGLGSIEISGAPPFIDFHANNSTADYTSRIVELESGVLQTNAKAVMGSTNPVTSPTANTRLHVLGDIHNTSSVYSGGKVCSGAKLTDADGLNGGVLSPEGTLYLQATSSPTIFFIRNGATSSNAYINHSADATLNYIANSGHNFTGRLNASSGLQWNGIDIPSGADLNDYTTPGIYKCPTTAAAQTHLNCPTTGAYSLVIFQSANGCHQILVTYHPDGANKRMYWRNIYNNNFGAWDAMAFAKETPMFGTYATNSTPVTSVIPLSNIYDIRMTGSGGATYNMGGFSGGIDGMEYIFSINNTGSSDLILNFPTGTAYQSNAKSITISGGTVGEIFIRYIFGKYLIRV